MTRTQSCQGSQCLSTMGMAKPSSNQNADGVCKIATLLSPPPHTHTLYTLETIPEINQTGFLVQLYATTPPPIPLHLISPLSFGVLQPLYHRAQPASVHMYVISPFLSASDRSVPPWSLAEHSTSWCLIPC